MVGVPNPKLNLSETLTRVPIFSGLSEAEQSFLAQRTVPRRFSAGAGGREQVLSIERPGAFDTPHSIWKCLGLENDFRILIASETEFPEVRLAAVILRQPAQRLPKSASGSTNASSLESTHPRGDHPGDFPGSIAGKALKRILREPYWTVRDEKM